MKIILGAAVTALALASVTQSAAQPTASGHSALALGALVGSYSPMLTNHDKAVLAELLEGKSASASNATIKVNADVVICRAGDVMINAFECELTFVTKKVTLTGRHANELFATIGEAGEPSEGAAGTIFEGIHAMSCTIDPAEIAQKDGGGATCNFASGPS
jgi:hypothetical protein